MEADFWHRRWAEKTIGFHRSEIHPLLERHLPVLGLPAGARVFVPLCGKTLDIGWLLGRGHRVVAVELSSTAIGQLFAALGRTPVVTRMGRLEHHAAAELEVFVGDVFDLTADVLGSVDAVYDRAALVALPETLRRAYARQLAALVRGAPALVIAYAYDQERLEGPPFSVPEAEVRCCFEGLYETRRLASEPVPGGLKGLSEVTEEVWLLTRSASRTA